MNSYIIFLYSTFAFTSSRLQKELGRRRRVRVCFCRENYCGLSSDGNSVQEGEQSCVV